MYNEIVEERHPGDRVVRVLRTRAFDSSRDWYQTLKPAKVRSFVELRALFPSADQVGKLTVFNIGGNAARLIAAIHYNRQKVYVRAILTHSDYDEGRWKK